MSQDPSSLPARKPGRWRGVALFTVGYLCLFLAAYLWKQNLEFLYYVAILVVIVPLVGLLHHRVGLGTGALWCLSLWGLLHMCGGLVPVPDGWPVHGGSHVLYSLWILPDRLRYDHVVHALGFGVTTWVCWQALQGALRGRGGRLRPTPGLAILCAAAGLGFGALNEVLEFAATLLLPQTNVGGYFNTGWDLVANTVGSLIAATLILLNGRSRPAP